MSEEIENHVLERYDMQKKLGRGAYGIVWKAVDKRTKKIVALKKVFEAFQNAVDAQRTYREVMYLQELKGHDNIVRLTSIIRAHNNRDLYLVFEYMETDLHAVIKAKILQSIHKQFIFYQLLKALKYIHSADLIHRDLKPSNLLINSECLVKVADFGLARSVAQKEDGQDPIVSDYVATRWYRAPEILLGSQKYNKAVDMWSAGCILAELIGGKVIFTGKSTINQIELIIELLGFPNDSQIHSLGSSVAKNVLSNVSTQKTKSFTQMFSGEGKDALDLLRKLLVFNPDQRLTVEEALNHPYVKAWHCEADEISCKKKIHLPVDDNTKLSLKEYRDAIYKDIYEKSKVTRKSPHENLPKINDKIKNIASNEKEGQEVSTTLGDKRSLKEDSRARRGDNKQMDGNKIRQHKSLDWKDSRQSLSEVNKSVKKSIVATQAAEPQPKKSTIKVGSKNHYKSLDVSIEHKDGKMTENSQTNWYRAMSPVSSKIKRQPSRMENSNHSSSKIGIKNSSSSVFDKESSKLKRSGYLLGSGVGIGVHKKSASMAQPYNFKSPSLKKEELLGMSKKSSSNYFFKKPKAKGHDENDHLTISKSSKMVAVGSHKSFHHVKI